MANDSTDWPDRFSHVRKILERASPFAHPDFEPSSATFDFIRNECRILVIGAGGLGCELLKNVALLGFTQIDVIDMDTIDLSNLNRQFLFRRSDIGKSKAQVAADFINKRVPGCNVTPHCANIRDYEQSFYQSFNIIVCGLDSVIARRWINGMLVSLLQYDEDGQLDMSTVIPMIDGGTEGFKGNARVVLPGISACVECTLDLYPPQINFPLCTIAHTPRLPEHCIEYVRLLLWPKENPFGGDKVSIDGDDPAHIDWIFRKAFERAEEYKITGVTYRLTQGVVKRIIPAVASTNAVIASVCATEVLKIASNCCLPLNNYMNFNDGEGIYTYTLELERKIKKDQRKIKSMDLALHVGSDVIKPVNVVRDLGVMLDQELSMKQHINKENCTVCCQIPQPLRFRESDKLQDVISYLQESVSYQLKSPGIVTMVNGSNKTLYMSTVQSIEIATRPNLKKTLLELGLEDGQYIYVADMTTPNSLTFQLHLSTGMEN